jgi:hypothetical protein
MAELLETETMGLSTRHRGEDLMCFHFLRETNSDAALRWQVSHSGGVDIEESEGG